jgi:nucleoside-diphosphate-sugar epimerase
MRVLVTGGCGYVGSVLTQALCEDGHEVMVVDDEWFGNHISDSVSATFIKEDVRNIDAINLDGIDTIFHMANIANDPGVELNETLSWEVNVLATQQLLDKAKRAGVSQFIYASSGSVYGVKSEPNVTEDLPLVPISAYNKTKMVAERVCISYSGDMQIHNIRPATVCGVSPRMRFDVSVNMFVKQAVLDGKMTVFGGDQVRPNIHVSDLVGVYQHFLANPSLPSGAYNAGFENISIMEIAERIQTLTGAEIIRTPSNDPRSYRQDSSKLVATGFTPTNTVDDAIKDVASALESGKIEDRDEWYTVRWMKTLEKLESASA